MFERRLGTLMRRVAQAVDVSVQADNSLCEKTAKWFRKSSSLHSSAARRVKAQVAYELQ